MAREKSPLLFSGSLEVEMQGPLDARRSVKRLTDLTDANSFPYIYKGLDVFCEENGKWYTFLGGDQTDINNWREEGTGCGGTSDFNDLTNRPKYLGDAMTNKTDVMGFELIEDHDGCYWYDDAYTWMGAWKKTPSGGATGHGMVVSRGQREIGLIKGDAGGSSSQRWRIPMADKVEDMLAEKADKTNTYTKTETDGKIAEAMTDVDNEHFHPVTALPDPVDEDPTKRPKENHEYILIEYEQDGTTIKSETHYLFYGGEYHQKSTGGISLDGYATTAYVNEQDASLSASISALQARIQTLEGKLANYVETRLKLSDGTTTVDKTILAKPYVAPTPPTPTTMFDLAEGAYDANGNYLGDFTWDDSGGDDTADIYGESAEFDMSIYAVRMNNIKTKYPTVRGIVLHGESISSVTGSQSDILDWIVLDMRQDANPGYISSPLFDNGVTDAVGTIYTKVTEGAPWGTTATINNTGTPLAWA